MNLFQVLLFNTKNFIQDYLFKTQSQMVLSIVMQY